ncbi:MAG: hypothetical protein Q9164_004894, partial [Protoblastenia rupestris]
MAYIHVVNIGIPILRGDWPVHKVKVEIIETEITECLVEGNADLIYLMAIVM